MASVSVEKIEIDGHTCQTFLDEETGAYSGFIFSTGEYVHDPYKNKPADYVPVRHTKSKEEIADEVQEIETYPTREIPERKLKDSALSRFNIKTGLSEADGESVATIHFPYTNSGAVTGYKTKLMEPKRFWSTGEVKDVDLFGWEQAIESGSPKLFITEGELDVVALYQMLKDKAAGTKWADLDPAVVSIPHGAGNAAATISKKINEIQSHFKDIVLAFDMDEPGQLAAESVVKLLPDALVATMPCKDANACLIEGRQKAFCNSVLFNASRPKNTRILTGASLSVAAKKKPTMGINWPWQSMTHLTKGIRRGEVIYFGAGVKQGKSILLSALAADIMTQHDLPVLIAKPEEAVVKTYQELVGQVAGHRFNDPERKFNEEAYDKADSEIKDKAFIIDAYQFVDWDTLKGDIKYAIVAEGVQDVYIDPITCLVNTMSSSDANEFLNGMSAEIASMTKDLQFTSYLFSHLKAPSSGEPHERGGKVQSSQFVNSRGMMRSCHQMYGLEGNRDPELDKDERNTRKLVLLEDREYGASGVINLHWNENSGRFHEL